MWKGDWLPKTNLQRDESNHSNHEEKDEAEENSIETCFRGGGIRLTPIEPMRKWRLQFDGNLCNMVSYTIINILQMSLNIINGDIL